MARFSERLDARLQQHITLHKLNCLACRISVYFTVIYNLPLERFKIAHAFFPFFLNKIYVAIPI